MQAVVREGKRLRTAHLDVRVVASLRSHCRIGFIVPKYGNSSVLRNRIKRVLRELTRQQLLGTLNHAAAVGRADIVVRVKPEVYHAPLARLQREFADLADRLGPLVGRPADTERGDTPRGSDA